MLHFASRRKRAAEHPEQHLSPQFVHCRHAQRARVLNGSTTNSWSRTFETTDRVRQLRRPWMPPKSMRVGLTDARVDVSTVKLGLRTLLPSPGAPSASEYGLGSARRQHRRHDATTPHTRPHGGRWTERAHCAACRVTGNVRVATG